MALTIPFTLYHPQSQTILHFIFITHYTVYASEHPGLLSAEFALIHPNDSVLPSSHQLRKQCSAFY